MSTTVSFASSAGWPSRKPPITSQLFMLAAVPAPVPMKSSRTSRTMVTMYIGTAIHSSIRTDARLIAYAPAMPRKNQINWVFHARAT